MSLLIVGISGIRGIYGETLTPEIVMEFACAFGTYIKGEKVAVGSDTRPSGKVIKDALFKGLLSTGCEIIDLGICPTPSVQLMVEALKAAGGIVISASHTPAEWNGLKFIRKDGIFLNEAEGKTFLKFHDNRNFIISEISKPVHKDTTTENIHINKVLACAETNIIKQKKFKVVLDSCNGAGSIITPKLLEALGCEVIKINCLPDGLFPHNPEPIPSNLKELMEKVRETGADIGFAQDADADRLAVVSEKGEAIGEEYSLCLAVKFVLSKTKGVVVTNLSTTRAVDDIAEEYGCRVIRTKVGEVNVAEKMKAEKAVIGGEGNGGIIDPRIHYGRDSLAGIALILQYLAETGKTLSQLLNGLPKYYIYKDKVLCSRETVNIALARFKEKYKNENLNFTDGIKVEWNDSWAHLRSSNTEPIIRIITEATSQEKAMKLNNEIAEEIRKLGVRS